MVNLGQLSASDSYAQTSGSGFGTRALCRRLTRHSEAPVENDVWLTGLRRANPFNGTTNPVVNAHMRSPGGFVESFAGLRDGGEISFEATFKNDAPPETPGFLYPQWQQFEAYDQGDLVSADDAGTMKNYVAIRDNYGDAPAASGLDWREVLNAVNDFQSWQNAKETDPVSRRSFFHSFFYDREPFEFWVIPPQWTRGLFMARGYASMVGPFPHEMEGVINFMGSFKISGRPMMLRGVSKPMGVGTPYNVSTRQDVFTGAQTAGDLLAKRYRAVSKDLLEEIWSPLGNITDTQLEWAELGTKSTAGSYNVYEYIEEPGFGAAF